MTPACTAWIEIEGDLFVCHRSDDHTGPHECEAEMWDRTMWITWRQN